MTRRFSPQMHRWIYLYLVTRDGERCYLCGGPPPLEIEHVDGNKDNDDPANLRLAHHGCNVGKENRHRVHRNAPGSVRVERDELTPNTRIFKETLPYGQGSPEMQANAQYETRVRRWLLAYINEHGFIAKKEAIVASAEIAGCNPMSAARYLDKMTSIVGPLMVERDATGRELIYARTLPTTSQLPLPAAPGNQLELPTEPGTA